MLTIEPGESVLSFLSQSGVPASSLPTPIKYEPCRANSLCYVAPYARLVKGGVYYPTNPRRQEFWRRNVLVKVEKMLVLAAYPGDIRQRFLRLYEDVMIPILGPSMSEYQVASTMPSSIMVDDHSPTELSWALEPPNRIVCRFYAEPLCSKGSPIPRHHWIPLLRRFITAGGISQPDLSWAKICMETLTTTVSSKYDSNTGPGKSQFVFGADLLSPTPAAKAYFWLSLRSQTHGIAPGTLVMDCMQRLGLDSQWKSVHSFLASRPPEHSPRPEIVAVGAISGHNSAKVYIRTQATILNDLLPYLTLGDNPRLVNVKGIQETISTVRRIWKALFDNGSAMLCDEGGWTSGFMVYYDLSPGRQYPHPKFFIPVSHRCPNDAYIASSLARYFTETGHPAGEWYERELRSIFNHRKLEEGTGIHTYVGVGLKGGHARVTLYYSPESFVA